MLSLGVGGTMTTVPLLYPSQPALWNHVVFETQGQACARPMNFFSGAPLDLSLLSSQLWTDSEGLWGVGWGGNAVQQSLDGL